MTVDCHPEICSGKFVSLSHKSRPDKTWPRACLRAAVSGAEAVYSLLLVALRLHHAKKRSGGRSRGGLIARRGGSQCPTRQSAPADDNRPVSAAAAQGLSPTVFPPHFSYLHKRSTHVLLSSFLSPSPSSPVFVSQTHLSFPLFLPPSTSSSPPLLNICVLFSAPLSAL